MEGGIPYGDIIVIAAIAAFILLRYRAMLGEPRGRDESATPPVQKPNDLERVVQLPAARAAQLVPEKKDESFAETYGSLAETLVAMRAIDREFSPEEFLSGARTAYEMVLTAYTKRDRETLKMLLANDVYASFDAGLKSEEADKRHTDTTLVAMNSARITDAKLNAGKATMTVEFVSDQVHLIRDEKNAILEGDVHQQNRVEDTWVFTRDLRSQSPNWLIVET